MLVKAPASFKLSIKDINFIRFYYTLLNFFLITPWYDFDKNIIRRPKILTLCGFFAIVIYIMRFGFVVMDQDTHNIYEQLLISQKIVWILSSVILVMTQMLVVCKCCFFNKQNWKRLIINFGIVDSRLGNVGLMESTVFKNFNIILLLKHSVCLIFLFYEYSFWAKKLKISIWKFIFITGGIEWFYEFLILTILNCFVQSLKSRYNDLNKSLTQLRSKNLIQQLRLMAQSYRILGETIDIINQIFGSLVLLMILHFGLDMVSCIKKDFLLLLLKFDGMIEFQSDVVSFVLLLWQLVNFLSIVVPMSSIYEESQRFINQIYKMQEFSEGSEEMRTLKRLGKFCEIHNRVFTAAGFFNLNKGTIFSVVATVATYVIITLQLDSEEQSKMLKERNF